MPIWPLWTNFFASVFGAFMYFATLTEVPILQGLIGSGMGKGPALALLLAGPALSLPSMLVIAQHHGHAEDGRLRLAGGRDGHDRRHDLWRVLLRTGSTVIESLIGTFANRAQSEKVRAMLESLSLSYRVISPEPGFGRVGVASLVLEEDTQRTDLPGLHREALVRRRATFTVSAGLLQEILPICGRRAGNMPGLGRH